ncbi:YcxB family protein [Thalassotalea nanhaiensis]|uniref:YcxB family protein n=1 Tax=Thalassotalea nanhaiensis TaxID=3065648 RepID=A0ABY9TGA9_9GAMM|nr:YcxB family protein [Colwelliaceae bacterium SQ345]
MKFKVEISKADYDAFNAYASSKLLKSHYWLAVIKNVILWLVLGAIFMSFFQFLSGGIESKYFYTILAISTPLLIYIVLGKLEEHKLVKSFTPNQNGIMIGSKEFEINSDGIKETHLFGHNFYKWNVVENIEEANGSVYVFVDKVLALIFTSESFESKEIKDEFLSKVQKYV